MRERLDYVDGLRAVAVMMVVVYHAWTYLHIPQSLLYSPPRGWWPALLYPLGDQGVSLFLVLSGFCLSYAPWRKELSGRVDWFSPREFFARRCLRILPPYWLALAVFTVLGLAAGPQFGRVCIACGSSPTVASVVVHLLMIQNLSYQYWQSIDGPMWSLGLEWQWYFVFPFVLVLVARSWRTAFLGAFVLSVLWLGVQLWLLLRLHVSRETVWVVGEPQLILFQRLFEFTCGVIVARSSVLRVRKPSLRYDVAACGTVAATVWGWHVLALVNLECVAGGLGFSFLLTAASQSRVLYRLLSLRGIAGVGIASYSIYLIHGPVSEIAEYALARFLPPPLVIIAGILLGCGAGAAFYVVWERYWVNPAVYRQLTPALTPLFRWSDRVYRQPGRLHRQFGPDAPAFVPLQLPREQVASLATSETGSS